MSRRIHLVVGYQAIPGKDFGNQHIPLIAGEVRKWNKWGLGTIIMEAFFASFELTKSYTPTELEASGIPFHEICSLKIDPGYKLIAITKTGSREFSTDNSNWQSASVIRREVKKIKE